MRGPLLYTGRPTSQTIQGNSPHSGGCHADIWGKNESPFGTERNGNGLSHHQGWPNCAPLRQRGGIHQGRETVGQISSVEYLHMTPPQNERNVP